jgi:hypothetical protein
VCSFEGLQTGVRWCVLELRIPLMYGNLRKIRLAVDSTVHCSVLASLVFRDEVCDAGAGYVLRLCIELSAYLFNFFKVVMLALKFSILLSPWTAALHVSQSGDSSCHQVILRLFSH